MTRFLSILTILSLTVLSACNNSDTAKRNGKVTDTVASTNIIQPIIICDTFQIDKPKMKDYKKAYYVFLETTSLDWFLEHRQSLWREAKAWHIKTSSVDSNSIIKCLCSKRQNIFLYIPNHFYNQEKNGNEYFRFYIVNNSSDTIQIPRLDNVINNISSSISTGDTLKWLSFQQTDKIIGCGNSIWTMKLPPKTATLSEIESDHINGSTPTVALSRYWLGCPLIASDRIALTRHVCQHTQTLTSCISITRLCTSLSAPQETLPSGGRHAVPGNQWRPPRVAAEGGRHARVHPGLLLQ